MTENNPPRQKAAEETDFPEQPARAKPTVVGIGASAGGLAALRTFFAHVPADSGLAFVVVVHLSPQHESHLPDLLQPHVQIPVRQVTNTIQLEPNQVYVIPPNANLNAIDTHLRLSELEEQRRERAPIDHFLRTLANTHDGNAIAVILTGTGSDGTLGIKDVKAKGGLIVVQDPTEAEYDGMPQSAIATGLADFILPLAEMPAALLRYENTTPKVAILPEEADLRKEEAHLLPKVLAQLRALTERDFTRYKRSTVLRRIARRMQLNYLEDLEAYLQRLREHPEEVRALADDLLVTVTNFFRDPEAFEKLEKEIIPRLWEGKGPKDAMRAWSVGCATGEEAYSLAILLLEAADRLEEPPRIQVFASDLHRHSLDKAREGFYPGDIESDISAERLKRFFQKEHGGYRVHKEVRDLVVFSPHNLLGDPPFSRLDLISCRNLLIYLQRDAQRDVIELFHYALNSDGCLLLGSAETIDAANLFRTEDKNLRLYSKRNVPGPAPRLPVFPLMRLPSDAGTTKERPSGPMAYRTLLQRTLERYAPPSLLIDPENKLAHLSGTAGRYLVHPSGDITSNAFHLVRKELQFELRGLLQSARDEKRPFDSKPIPVGFNGTPTLVVMRVRPVLEPGYDGFALVIFEEASEPAKPKAARAGKAVEPSQGAKEGRVAELEDEINVSQQRLQALVEEYESSQEEMKAANEEMQSTNEELRSTMEELETSKEELQSVNEELQTVNQENRHKVEELAQLSSDLHNLLMSTDVATLFLDRKLRILRFTPGISNLFNIRASDRGRPILDLTHHLGYDELEDDAKAVLQRLIPVEREVLGNKDRWYLTRLLPYRSSDDRIEGVVVTFVDITMRKRAEEELRKAKSYDESIINTLHEPLLVLHPDLKVQSANPAFYSGFRVTPEETVGRKVYELGNGQWNIPALRRLLEEVLPDSNVFNDYEVDHEFEGIGRRVMLVNARRLDHVQLILLGVRDITDKKRADELVRQSEERYRFLVESAREYAMFVIDAEERISSWNTGAQRIFGYSEQEAVGMPAAAIFTDEDQQAGVPEAEMEQAKRVGQASDERWHVRKDGSKFWASGVMEKLTSADGSVRFAKVLRDNTERKQAEEELQRLNESLEKRVEARTRKVRELSSQLTMAEHQERDRIAQILHDDLQQLLYALRIKLMFLREGLEKGSLEDSMARATQAEEGLDEGIAIAHRLSVDLSPQILKQEGLREMIGWLADQMREQHQLDVELRADASFPARQSMRVLLFQAVRELLFNVVKHAGVKQAVVDLRQTEDSLLIEVSDQGQGFAANKANSQDRFGLSHLRSRLLMMGGAMNVDSQPGRGARVTLQVPLELIGQEGS